MGKEDQPSGQPAAPLTDASVVTMTPAPVVAPPAGEHTPPAPPARRVVKLSGKDIEVDADTADAIEAREVEIQHKLSEQGEELGRLRKTATTAGSTPPAAPAPKKDLSKLMFEQPEEFIRELKQEVREELVSEYRNDQGEKAFWSDFSNKYPDLTHAQTLSRMLLAKHYTELGELKVDEAQKRLADYTVMEINRLSKRSATPPSPGSIVEPSSGHRPATPPAAPSAPTKLSDVIRGRQEARRQAQHHQGTKK